MLYGTVHGKGDTCENLLDLRRMAQEDFGTVPMYLLLEFLQRQTRWHITIPHLTQGCA
jgi:hypothetical protein